MGQKNGLHLEFFFLSWWLRKKMFPYRKWPKRIINSIIHGQRFVFYNENEAWFDPKKEEGENEYIIYSYVLVIAIILFSTLNDRRQRQLNHENFINYWYQNIPSWKWNKKMKTEIVKTKPHEIQRTLGSYIIILTNYQLKKKEEEKKDRIRLCVPLQPRL